MIASLLCVCVCVCVHIVQEMILEKQFGLKPITADRTGHSLLTTPACHSAFDLCPVPFVSMLSSLDFHSAAAGLNKQT